MPFVNVSKNEAKTVSADDPVNMLGTFSISDDIAITFYNANTRKAGLARTYNHDDLLVILNELIDGDNRQPHPVVEVRLVGGDNSPAARAAVEEVLKDIEMLDAERKILNIVSSNINETPHPESFRISAVDGSLSLM